MMPTGKITESQTCRRAGKLNPHSADQQHEFLVLSSYALHFDVKQGVQHQTGKIQVLLKLTHEMLMTVVFVQGATRDNNNQHEHVYQRLAKQMPEFLFLIKSAPAEKADKKESLESQQHVRQPVHVIVLIGGFAIHRECIGPQK